MNNFKLYFLFLSSVIYLTDVFVHGANLAHAKNHFEEDDLVQVTLLYEVLCPYSIKFFDEFVPAVLKLYDHLNITMLPYGNAKVVEIVEKTYTIECQHGEPECHGNSLHACALDKLEEKLAIEYNGCMMELQSDDKAADECGKRLKIDSKRIKECGGGVMGFILLWLTGEESRKYQYSGVPYVLINNEKYDGDNFLQALCAAFKSKPEECNNDT